MTVENSTGWMKVYRPGTTINLKDDLEGTIIAVNIARHQVQYQVVWWDGRARKAEWLSDFEVVAKEQDLVTVGFQQPATYTADSLMEALKRAPMQEQLNFLAMVEH